MSSDEKLLIFAAASVLTVALLTFLSTCLSLPRVASRGREDWEQHNQETD